jgi:flavin-dependent thymidylate synthase
MDNSVELIDWYGNDTTHALSAWTSTNRDLTDEKVERIPNLLKMLAQNGHETPFEKSALHFLVTCDQASHIHLLKHRIGVSINAESARYKELKEDKYYLPEDWNVPFVDDDTLTAHASEIFMGYENWKEVLQSYTNLGNELYHKALRDFTPILGRKRAKESARFFKTMNSQITMDVMFNFRSFVHFQRLRNHHDAQKEIADIADKMLELVENIEGKPFEYTLKAFKL